MVLQFSPVFLDQEGKIFWGLKLYSYIKDPEITEFYQVFDVSPVF